MKKILAIMFVVLFTLLISAPAYSGDGFLRGVVLNYTSGEIQTGGDILISSTVQDEVEDNGAYGFSKAAGTYTFIHKIGMASTPTKSVTILSDTVTTWNPVFICSSGKGMAFGWSKRADGTPVEFSKIYDVDNSANYVVTGEDGFWSLILDTGSRNISNGRDEQTVTIVYQEAKELKFEATGHWSQAPTQLCQPAIWVNGSAPPTGTGQCDANGNAPPIWQVPVGPCDLPPFMFPSKYTYYTCFDDSI